MTNKEQVYNYIKQYIKDHGVSPNQKQITKGTNIDQQVVVGAILRLKKDGLIRNKVRGYGYVILTTL